jgi:transposase
MERTELFDLMGALKLYGMRASYDEVMAAAIKRQHEPPRVVGDLLKAEIAEKHARSIKYRKRCCEALVDFVVCWRRILYDPRMQRTVHFSDDRSDDPRLVSPRRIEVFTGCQERRRWPDDVKACIVMESLAPGVVVTQLAQRHGCRAQQIHDWRRLARTGRLALPAPVGSAAPAFVPLLPDHSSPAQASTAAEVSIEVEIAGAKVRIVGRPSAEALADVFSALRRSR